VRYTASGINDINEEATYRQFAALPQLTYQIYANTSSSNSLPTSPGMIIKNSLNSSSTIAAQLKTVKSKD